jgi:DNA repair protein SbcC/Rad50
MTSSMQEPTPAENSQSEQNTSLETSASAPRPMTEKEKLQRAIPGTSHRDLPTLTVLETRLMALLADHGDDAELLELQEQLRQRMLQHDEWQKSIIGDVENSVTQLQLLLTEGRLREAQSLWDKNQNILKRTGEAEQQRLQELLLPHKAELTKLLDWKRFAASEKKRELIEKMTALSGEDLPPATKARQIRELQDEWKLLGHSDDNDTLWIQFSELSKTAFEPCKIYFKERKEKQAANLIARTNICEQLEAYISSLQDTEIDLAEAARLEQKARTDWKTFAPVAQNKIKNLQNRFNKVLTELKLQKRGALQAHNAKKRALIEQAQALVDSEDLAAAINTAKRLQNDWKALGPGSFKDDRKLWSEFRAACDALFARRDEQSRAQKQESRKASSAARDLINRISALLTLEDEAFIDSKAEFQSLRKAFREALTSDQKANQRALQEQFNKVTRRYEQRVKATPDKKSLQLAQQITQRAELCRQIEEQLLAGKPVSDSAESLSEQWSEFDQVSDANWAALLDKRFTRLLEWLPAPADNARQIANMAQQLADEIRELCVDTEIMCGAETPLEDKAIRMQQQLNQLQKGLGRLPATQKERLEKIQEADLQLNCSGPLSGQLRSSFMQRLQKVRQIT